MSLSLVRRSVLVGLMLMVSMMMVSCGGEPVVGQWTVDKAKLKEMMTANAKEEESELAQQMAESMVSSMEMTLEVKGDGTWTMSTKAMGQTHEQSGTWEKAKGGYKFTSSDGPGATVEVKGGRMYVQSDKDKQELPFERVKK